MALRDELLKAIWHAFTALDVDKSGKVSKSQLKVLSHNLCTVMKIPHDPVALEEHFRDDDEGPVSNQGYMPHLNRFILDKIEYFLRKLTEAMGGSWIEEKFEEYKIQLSSKHQCLNVWELIELVGMGHFSKGMDRQTLSMGINEVFQELILDMLKQGYMMKKGHKRKNWTERWFLLNLPFTGKKCLFYVKCSDKSFEISASDKKKKQEWIQAIQTCITLLKVGRPAPHLEARQKRRELRQKQQSEQEELELRMRELQTANENKQRELEALRKKLEEAAANAAEEEHRRLQTQSELQDLYRVEMEKEKMVRQQMEEQVAQKSSELEQYLQRVRELENMYHRLEEALEEERQARQDEETVRKLQARLLEEEVSKRAELEQVHLYQQQTISQTQAEKQELERERLAKESALQSAMQQLQQLEADRQGALEQYEEVMKKLADAANNTKSWKDKVSHHEGLIRLIQPGPKYPQKITNWGPAAFTETELSLREKDWQEKKNRPATPQ
uniref:Switch-associated protein 70-like n=1 Tax=Sinocyclocheilus anshuiensis TaxID=1608454 RepID=A0A671M0C1_9TELE